MRKRSKLEPTNKDPEAHDKCMGEYMQGEHFKGKPGARFDNCEKAFDKCFKGWKDEEGPAGLCAQIARGKGKIPSGPKKEGSSLRGRLVRLAHQRKDLRPFLLPLLLGK